MNSEDLQRYVFAALFGALTGAVIRRAVRVIVRQELERRESR